MPFAPEPPGELPGAPRLEEVGASAAALPPPLSARAFGWGWLIAIAVHLLLAGGLVGFGRPSPALEPPVARMVFVEPPPPPPAPVGRQRAADTEKIVVPDATIAKPVRKRMARPKPDRVPPPERRLEPAATPEEVAPAIASASTAGQAEAVVAGISGGVTGGVVGAAGKGPVPAGQVATPPSLVRRVEPKYPAEARRQEIAGLVVVEAILDRQGRVEPGVRVLRSIPTLDEEALAAVRQWRFRPARDRDGSPVRVILEVPIRFVLR
jgi:protein TonB